MRRVLTGVVTGLLLSVSAIGCVEMAEPEGIDDVEGGEQGATARPTTLNQTIQLGNDFLQRTVKGFGGGLPVGKVGGTQVGSSSSENKFIADSSMADLS